MASFKNGAPVYPKSGANVNIFIPAVDKDKNKFFAISKSQNGEYLNDVGDSSKEGNMMKYYQVKSRFDQPDYTDPNISFGTFTGKTIEFNGSIYQNIVWNHEWFEHGFLGFNPRLQRETIANAYVLDREVQGASQSEIEKKEKSADDKELDDYLDGLLGNDKKQLTASGGTTTGITANTTNIILGVIIVFVLGLIGFGTYKKFKR